MMIQRVEEYVLIPRPAFKGEKIQEVVETTLQTFSKGAAEKGISLNLETGALEGEGNLFIDKDLVIKVLSHILENSMEAITEIPVSKKRTAVKVTLFEDKEDVRVSISDKGEGIAKKNLDRIFEPFFSTRPNRVGLGLTFAKRVMEEHGGRIRVESRLKRGTTIDLYFPKERRREVRRKLISPEAMGERIQ